MLGAGLAGLAAVGETQRWRPFGALYLSALKTGTLMVSYSPGNDHISPEKSILKTMFLFPKLEYVSSLEGI